MTTVTATESTWEPSWAELAIDDTPFRIPDCTNVESILTYLFDGLNQTTDLGPTPLPPVLVGFPLARLRNLAKEQALRLRPDQLQALFEGRSLAEARQLPDPSSVPTPPPARAPSPPPNKETTAHPSVPTPPPSAATKTSSPAPVKAKTETKAPSKTSTQQPTPATGGGGGNRGSVSVTLSPRASVGGAVRTPTPTRPQTGTVTGGVKAEAKPPVKKIQPPAADLEDKLREELLRQQALASLRRASREGSNKTKTGAGSQTSAAGSRRQSEDAAQTQTPTPSTTTTTIAGLQKPTQSTNETTQQKNKISEGAASAKTGAVAEEKKGKVEGEGMKTKMIQVAKKDGSVVTVSMKVHIPEAARKRAQERQEALQAKKARHSLSITGSDTESSATEPTTAGS